MVVERLDGETIARKLLRDDEYATARRVLGAQVGEALARIHAMPSDAVEGLRQTDQLEQFRTVLDTLGEPHPAFELGFRWLEANAPPPPPSAWCMATSASGTSSSTRRACGPSSTGS